MGHISCEKGTRPSHLSAALKAIDSFQYDKTALQIEQNVLHLSDSRVHFSILS